MARNQKLTALIKGRAVTAIEPHGGGAAVHFDDGSVMTVQMPAGTAVPVLPGAPGAPGGAQVRAVRQQGTNLALDLEGGATVAFETAEPTASVIVRDKAQGFEYAD